MVVNIESKKAVLYLKCFLIYSFSQSDFETINHKLVKRLLNQLISSNKKDNFFYVALIERI